jgi:hypothetical protein
VAPILPDIRTPIAVAITVARISVTVVRISVNVSGSGTLLEDIPLGKMLSSSPPAAFDATYGPWIVQKLFSFTFKRLAGHHSDGHFPSTSRQRKFAKSVLTN